MSSTLDLTNAPTIDFTTAAIANDIVLMHDRSKIAAMVKTIQEIIPSIEHIKLFDNECEETGVCLHADLDDDLPDEYEISDDDHIAVHILNDDALTPFVDYEFEYNSSYRWTISVELVRQWLQAPTRFSLPW